jgi:hypothetical protein
MQRRNGISKRVLTDENGDEFSADGCATKRSKHDDDDDDDNDDDDNDDNNDDDNDDDEKKSPKRT